MGWVDLVLGGLSCLVLGLLVWVFEFGGLGIRRSWGG